MSPLNVGYRGQWSRRGTLALHHRDLPGDQPLFVIRLRDAGRCASCGGLGINAARLVKGEPLVLQDEADIDEPASRHCCNAASNHFDEHVERIVQSVLAELAKA